MAATWFASLAAQSQSTAQERTRSLIFNQQTRDAASLTRKLHDTLSSAINDSHPFKHAIFCTNTTYKDAGFKADLVSINTNKSDVDTLKVQRELADSWDSIDPD